MEAGFQKYLHDWIIDLVCPSEHEVRNDNLL